jgi:hypothetical protein
MKVFHPMIVSAVLLTARQAAATANSAESPLPPVDAVLQRVVERAQIEDDQEREFKARYYYVRSKATEFRSARGELKKREAKTGANQPTGVPAANRPATTAQVKSNLDSDVDPSPPVTDTHSNVRGRAFEKSEFPLNDDLLKRFQFTLAGREVLNGRPALIVDFQPAQKKQPVRNFKDRFINKAAGRAWVDEADYALVKADLYLTERVNVVGGLVGAVWKFTYGFIRERTPDSLWFTRHSNWHLEGREVFVRRIVDFHEERTDVRKVF